MQSLRTLPTELLSLLSRPVTTTTPSLTHLPNALSRRAYLTSTSSTHTSQHNQPKPRPQSSWLPVPFITESIGGAHHTTDLFSRLLKERIVAIYGEVDDRMAATVTASLLFLEADAPQKPISLYINSPGGSVTSGLAIYDTLQYITPSITTICLGQAASMGSLLLAGGSPGRRFCLPHSSVMLHQPSGGYFGTAADIAIHAREILRVRGELNKIYEHHLTPKGTKGTPMADVVPDKEGKKEERRKFNVEEIEKMMERDYFLSAKEALELGVVDEILSSRKEVDEKVAES